MLRPGVAGACRVRRLYALGLLVVLAQTACTKSPVDIEVNAARLLSRNESRSAVVTLKDLLQREPNRAVARLLLGQALNDQDDYAAAEGELRRAAKLGASADQVAVPLARAMLYQERYQALIEEPLIDAVQLPAARAEVLDRKANALIALGRRSEAVSALEEARRLAPELGAPSATLASLMLSEKRDGDAVALLEAAIRSQPRSAELQHAYGLYLLRARRSGEALGAFGRAVDFAVGPPRDRQLQRRSLAALVDAQILQRDFGAAEATLARLDGLGRGRVNGLLRARLNLLKGDVQAARSVAEVLVAQGREDPDAALLLGVIHAVQGNTGQAESLLNGVLAVMPANPFARQILAQIRLSEGKPRDAAALLQPLLEASPSDELLIMAARANMVAGNAPAANALLTKATQSNSLSDVAVAADLARALLAAGEPDKALAALPPSRGLPVDAVATLEGLRLAALLSLNDDKPARKLASELAAREPGNAPLQLLLSDFYTRVGALDLARKAAERAATGRRDDPGAALRLARLDAMAGDPAAAESRLVAAAARNPANATLPALLAELRAARGDSKAALAAIAEAQKLAPTDTNLWLREAQLRLASGDLQGANRATAVAARQAPANKAVLNARVATLVQSKDHAAALKLVEDALRDNPGDPAISVLHANVLASAGQIDAAISTVQQLVKADPRSIPLLSTLAELQLRKGDTVSARATARSVDEVIKGHPAAISIDAEIAVREKRFAAAADAFATANVRAKSANLAVREFGVRREGKLVIPEQSLTRWLQDKPDDLAVTLVLAEYRLSQGDARAALALYERVLARDGNNVLALNNAAFAAGQLGEPKAALTFAERAFARAPRSAPIADTYGWVLTRNGQHAKALEVLDKARREPGALPDMEHHYAMALMGLGHRREAMVVLDTVLEANVPFASRAEAVALRATLE